MRLGCALLVGALIGACGLAAGSAWIGPRLFQEPEIAAAAGTFMLGTKGQATGPQMVGLETKS